MRKGLSMPENGIGRTGARRRDGEARCGERANVGEWVGDVPATAVEAPASAAILPPAPLIRHRARGRTLTHLTRDNPASVSAERRRETTVER